MFGKFITELNLLESHLDDLIQFETKAGDCLYA